MVLSVPARPVIAYRCALECEGKYESYAPTNGDNAGCFDNAAHSIIRKDAKIEEEETDLDEGDTCGVENFLDIEKLMDLVSRLSISRVSWKLVRREFE